MSKISVVGLGKLGLCMAVVFAHRGFRVVGVDVDESKLASVRAGRSPIHEPGLQDLMRSSGGRLSVTASYDEAVMNTDVTFVVVPTPSAQNGDFSLNHVAAAVESIGRVLSRKSGYHLVVVTSTVMPGSMASVVRPILERSSGKACGKSLGLCYNPEFIALGEVVKGLLEPDFVLIGESDKQSGDVLSALVRRVCKDSPPIERMGFAEAELAKISVNSFVTMKMSFANILAEICESIPGADVDRVTRAIGKDKRIGSAYLRGALGYGGPCFPRDNIAFANFAKSVGVSPELALATHGINVWQVERVAHLIESKGFHPPSRIGILGLTYKPNTDVLEASQSFMLAKSLLVRGFEVHAYDPAVRRGRIETSGIEIEESMEECVRKSELCVIATPWKAFSDLEGDASAGKVILDCWRQLQPARAKSGRLITIGRGEAKANVVVDIPKQSYRRAATASRGTGLHPLNKER